MRAYLQRMQPDTREIWYYSLQVQRDLLGRWQVIREWGRDGSPGTLRCVPFETLGEALAALESHKHQLVGKGYRVVMQEGLKPALAAILAAEAAASASPAAVAAGRWEYPHETGD